MAQVEVYEVLRLCGRANGPGQIQVGSRGVAARGWSNIPCVTKLPKLRPTMQCHVGPFRSSNCPKHAVVSLACAPQLPVGAGTHRLLDVLRDVLSSR